MASLVFGSSLASRGRWNPDGIAPRADSSIAGLAVFTGGQAMTVKLPSI
jgi:hypothetical protein